VEKEVIRDGQLTTDWCINVTEENQQQIYKIIKSVIPQYFYPIPDTFMGLSSKKWHADTHPWGHLISSIDELKLLINNLTI
jgi:hypothetical protein